MASRRMRRTAAAVALLCLALIAAAAVGAPSAAVADESSTPSPAPSTQSAARLTLVARVSGGPAQASGWALTATDARSGTTLSGDSGAAAVTQVPVTPGEFTLTASPHSSGTPWSDYTTAWSCTGAAASASANSATAKGDGASSDGSSSTVTVGAGEDVTCTATLTYAAPRLTLNITVDGGPTTAADWSLTASGPAVASGAPGSSDVTDAAVDSGAYRLSAAIGAGSELSGYALGTWSCTGASHGGAADGVVTLSRGDVVACRVTASWTRAFLTLRAELAPAADHTGSATGPAEAQDWSLVADGDGGVVTGRTGASAEVSAGRYSLDIAPTVARDGEYRFAGWYCYLESTSRPVTVEHDAVTVRAGQSTTCVGTEQWVGTAAATQPAAPSTPAPPATATPSARPSATPTPTSTSSARPTPGGTGSGNGTDPASDENASAVADRDAEAAHLVWNRIIGYGVVILLCAAVAAYFALQRRRDR